MSGRRVGRDILAIVVFVVIMVAWTGAWNLKLVLDNSYAVFKTEWAGFVFWVIAKILLWIIPSFWLIKKTGRTIREVFNVHAWRRCLAWGCGLGGILALVGIVSHRINNDPILPGTISFSLANAIVIAPIFEEFLMRGAIMGALSQKHSFLFANSVTAILFVVLHCPGWYYMGNLSAGLYSFAVSVISIFIIGWLCGLATKRGRSVIAGVIVHFLNNLI
ncbi:MAG: CPBP family intramembrane metalloprotease [Oscillospiraceae bacterium]|jgi:membrane protease YdiL (CAAX protease family)|nr:CPBP family intramembrane metalloprotease [Oscillospiraceae bacterium]